MSPNDDIKDVEAEEVTSAEEEEFDDTELEKDLVEAAQALIDQKQKKVKVSDTPMVDAVLAKHVQCSYVSKRFQVQCKGTAVLGGERCQHHLKAGRPKVLGPYSKALANAPTWMALMEEVKASGQYRKQEDDLVFLRTSLMHYIQSNATKIEAGDLSTIEEVNNMIMRISSLIERMDGKKYVVTLNGINVIINQVVEIVKLHLGNDPDTLTRIAEDLSKVRLPSGSLAR